MKHYDCITAEPWRPLMAANCELSCYQRKIGSFTYTTVPSHPNIVEAPSNSSTSILLTCLELICGQNDWSIAWKRPQIYAIKPSNGLIQWQTNKQDAVLTSTMEAERPMLSQERIIAESSFTGRPRRSWLHPNINVRYIPDHTHEQQCGI